MSALDRIEAQMIAKRVQLMDYLLGLIDQEGAVATHARTTADGRMAELEFPIERWTKDGPRR